MSETLPDRNFHSVRAFAENRQARVAAKNCSGCFPSWRQGFVFQFFEDVGSGEISYFSFGSSDVAGRKQLRSTSSAGLRCWKMRLCSWSSSSSSAETNSVLHPKVPVSVVHRFACAQCRYNQFYPLPLHRENGGYRCCQTISRNGCSCR